MLNNITVINRISQVLSEPRSLNGKTGTVVKNERNQTSKSMKRYTSFLAASLMLAALAPLPTRAADNTWNNGSTDFLWNSTSLNWASPTTWVDGDNAIFNATGAGTISLSAAITVHNQTFNSAGYTIAGVGNALTLASTTPTITVNASATNDASISGTDGLTVAGTSVLTLLGDSSSSTPGNTYTGGTFVKSGTLILKVGTLGTSPTALPSTAYAVDSIEGIDVGAIVREGNVNDGLDTATSNQKVPNGQTPTAGTGSGLADPHRLNLTGGTYDTFGNDNTQQQPQPSGFGTIINTSPNARGILKFVSYGVTTTFSGQIMDGGATIARTNNGPGYQMNVDSQGGTAGTIILSGSNSFTGFIRIGNNGTIQLSGAGTLGYPTISSPLRQMIQNNGVLDLNGTSQRTGYYYTGNSGAARITNTAIGTLSILTVGVNSTNLATFTNSGVSKGIQTDIQDDPATSGLIGLTKEGACVQPIGLSGGGTAPINNYHGDTTVNDGTLLVFSAGAISPNSTYRLNTTQGKLHLEYVGDALVRGLYINGLEMSAGTYSSTTAPITGTGTITVPPPNTWNNASGDFLWNATSLNWTLPTTWADGANAIFGATGAGAVTLGAPVAAHNIKFTAPGYSLTGAGNALTLVDAGATITANAGTSNYLGVSIDGTSDVTFNGPGTTVLAGDASIPDANRYTGTTYFRSGTVILAAAGAGRGTAAGDPHAVESIGALDTGATVQFGTTFDGTSWVSAPGDQIGAKIPGAKLVMTGGTLDYNNDFRSDSEVIPVPDGFGLIINNGSAAQCAVNVIMDGLDHTYSGLINDGNNGVLTGNNFGAGLTPQGPGYQIGIVSISSIASGSTWTLAGDNTYSGSIRIDGGTTVKLAGNHSLGIPTLTNSLTGPMRLVAGSAIDFNGRNQTIALMTDGSAGQMYNSKTGTVSTLTVGYGNENAANRACSYQFLDNTGVGGIFAFRKIITQAYTYYQTNITTSEIITNVVTNCLQTLKAACVATYSGDTSVDGGTLKVQGPSAISPNSAYRLSTANYANLWLDYVGDAPVRQLWINGVQQPNGTYGAGTPGIDPTSTGTITVTGFAPAALGVTQSGSNLNFSWSGVYQLQSSTNNVLGPYSTYVGAGLNAATVPINPNVGAVYFRLATY